MTTGAIDNLRPLHTSPSLSSGALHPDLAETQRSFLSVLGKEVDEPAAEMPDQQARRIAEQLVSISFIQPMLKQLRSTNNAAPPFAPTAAEKQFRALTDADLASKIVHAKQFPLVDRLASDMLKRAGTLGSGESVQDELRKSLSPDLTPSPRMPGATVAH